MKGADVPGFVRELKFKNAKGITPSGKRDTNRGLAERDYSVKCETGSEPLMVVEGFWLWFCHSHHQPLAWCERAHKDKEILKLKTRIEDAKRILQTNE